MNPRVLLIGPNDTSFIGTESMSVDLLMLQSARKMTEFQRGRVVDYQQVDLDNFDECRLAARGLDANSPLAAVITFFEPWLDLAAIICADLNIYGNPLSAVRAAKDKALTRELTEGSILRNPLWSTIRAGGDIKEAVEKVGLPCVAKPISGAGSKGVTVLATRDDVNNYGPVMFDSIVEEYVTGIEVSVESFSRDGHHEVVAVTGKVMSEGKQRVDLSHWSPFEGSFPPGFDLDRAISELMRRIGHQIGPGHTEIMIGDANVYLIETHTATGVTESGSFVAWFLVGTRSPPRSLRTSDCRKFQLSRLRALRRSP